VLHDGVGNLDRGHGLLTGDALVAITFAPYSAETVSLAESAVQRGLPVIAVTDTAISPIASGATALLTVPEVDFGAFRSLSATLALAIALAVAVGAARSDAQA
jgi:DNA-binding MurR/RpiR family transcriptional regulator